MTAWQSAIEQDLNRIFDSCAENNSNQAHVEKLALVLSQNYASEEEKQSELKEVLLKKFILFSENEYISRSVFLAKLKLWVRERESFMEERGSIKEDSSNDWSSGEFILGHPSCSSTPHLPTKANTAFIVQRKFEEDLIETQSQLSSVSSKEDGSDRSKDKKALLDKNHLLESFLCETTEKMNKIRKKNDSLESRLTKSEHRNQSLEIQIEKMANEYSQKLKRLMDEQINHVHLITELQEKLKECEDRCSDLGSENLRMKSDLDKCLCKELQQKNDDLLQEVENLQKNVSAMKEKDFLIYSLRNELQKLNVAEELNLKIISELRNERDSFMLSQKELISSIGELRIEKRNLQEKMNELLDEKEEMFPEINCHERSYQDLEQRESGISVRSCSSFGYMVPERLDEIFTYSNPRSLSLAVQTENIQCESTIINRYISIDRITQTEELLNDQEKRLISVDRVTQTEYALHDRLKRHMSADVTTQTEDIPSDYVKRYIYIDRITQTEEILNDQQKRYNSVDSITQTEEVLNDRLKRQICTEGITQTEEILNDYLKRNIYADSITQTEEVLNDRLKRPISTDGITQTEEMPNEYLKRHRCIDRITQTEVILNDFVKRPETPESPIPPGLFNRRLKWRIVRQGFI